MLCGVAIINKHRPFNQCLTFYGPFKERGEKNLSSFALGGTCPPLPSSSYAHGSAISCTGKNKAKTAVSVAVQAKPEVEIWRRPKKSKERW